MSFSRKFEQQPRPRIVVEMIIVMILIGLADFESGYQLSFFLFYGAPIFVVAWFCDRKSSILVALIAGIIWWWADWQAGHPYLTNWVEGWETLVRLGFFLLVAFGGSALRAKSNMAEARIALLEHSQRLELEIVSISEEERRRIGQDLHDGICQHLAALACASTSLRDDLNKLKLVAEAKAADELARLLQEAVVQTRDLARGLVPVHLEEDGLLVAMEGLAHSVTRLQGINCTFESKGIALKYQETAAMHLYRIAQEAINNATKHGKARNINISLEATKAVTTLQIADDGTGISRTATSSRGMGLNIMGYRARLTGGHLKVEEPERGGTVVLCTTPTPLPAG